MSSWFQAGGPAQYNQACKLSSNLFVDKLNIYVVGYPGTWYTFSWTMAGDNLIGLLLELLKQSTPASTQGPVNSWRVISLRARDGERERAPPAQQRGKYESKRN